jgi:hypothetical protein
MDATAITTQLHACISRWNACTHGPKIKLDYEIPIFFGGKPTQLGVIAFENNKVTGLTFNPVLWSADYSDADRFQTITHEIAHAIEVLLTGTTNHKHLWQRIHRFLGGDGQARATAKHEIPAPKFKKVVRWLVTDKNTGKRLASLTQKAADKAMGVAHNHSIYGFTKMFREVVRENGKLVAKYSALS